MIEKRTETIVTEHAVCDIRLDDLGGTGWAIVRRWDGLEVAHFGRLDDLRDNGGLLFTAAWAASKDADEVEEVAA